MEYLGQKLMMKCGMVCEVIEYTNYADIVVKFEDNTKVSTSYSNFKKGIVFNPSLGEPHKFYKRQEMMKHIGESRINCQGLKVTVIDAGTNSGVKVQYETDDIKDDVEYNVFLNSPMRLQGYSAIVGTTFTNTQGLEVKIISRGSKKGCFNVRFPDGATKDNVDSKSISLGQVRHPNYKLANENIGLTNVNTQGLNIKIDGVSDDGLTYIVRFDDNTIRDGITFSAFKRGDVPHPDEKERHIGEEFLSRQGLRYRVIEKGTKGGTWKVVFPDGSEIDNVGYSKIKSCNLCHPDIVTNGLGTFGRYKGYDVRNSFDLGGEDVYYICKNDSECIISRLCDL